MSAVLERPAVERHRGGEPAAARLLPADATYASVTDLVTAPLLDRRPGRLWWAALAVSLLATLAMLGAVGVLFAVGVGTWGVNSVVVWGFAIASYVWWIAIASGGTLISSMLLLTRQPWRASIGRAAETMTLFALAIAGLFPILHLGRPWFFYWLAPYPNTMALWPQWRSALVWDFWAIASYLIFSILFWYLGAIPDLATVRDRARTRAGQVFYGALALGWRGSAGQWHSHGTIYRIMAALAVPLVVSVHSIVGLDFAASMMPGWQESIFPAFFVMGALYSGFATVVLLTILVRWGLELQALVTDAHLDAMAKILLAASILMTYCYATEWFMAWYGSGQAERTVVGFAFTGDYAPFYRALLLFNCLLPQALWLRRARRSVPVLIGLCVLIDVGMWLERVTLILDTLARDFLPSVCWGFHPTLWDWLLLLSPLGLFSLLFLLFMRLMPAISIHEVRRLVRAGGAP